MQQRRIHVTLLWARGARITGEAVIVATLMDGLTPWSPHAPEGGDVWRFVGFRLRRTGTWRTWMATVVPTLDDAATAPDRRAALHAGRIASLDAGMRRAAPDAAARRQSPTR